MDSSKKFQQAFDSLLNDFNTRIDEVRSNIQNLTADVKVQVEGQKENLQEYGEKIKGRITQIVDIDKVRANVLAEAENAIDDTKFRIEKLFHFINEQVNLGGKKAKKSASTFTKNAEKFSAELEKDVKKAATKLDSNIKKTEAKIEKKVAAVAKDVKAAAKKVAPAPTKKAAAPTKKAAAPANKAAAPAKKTAAIPAKKVAAPAKKAVAAAPAKKTAAKKATK